MGSVDLRSPCLGHPCWPDTLRSGGAGPSLRQIGGRTDKLQRLGDPQAASHLLRCCLGAAKVVHLLRTASYTECAAFAKKVRALLKSAWGTVIGATLTEAHWSLASLPVRLGGFGASDPVIIHPQAAVASFLSAASGRAGLPLTRLDPDLRDAVEGLCLTLPKMAAPLRDLWLSVSLPVLLDDPRAESWAEQKVWTSAVHETLALRFDREASDRMERLRKLCAGANGGAWVTNLPLEHDGCTCFTSDEWQILCRFRLGLPLCSGTTCGGCGSPQDAYGDHALSCPACGTYARHNGLRDTLAAEFNRAGVPTKLEEPLPDGSSRSDILLLEPAEILPEHIDVSAVHPLHLSASPAEAAPGTAAAQREALKLSSEGAQECRRRRQKFTPVAAETTGAWGPAAQRCIRGLARKQSMRLGEALGPVARRLWRRLSAAVAKGTARMLLRGFGEALGGGVS